MRRPKTSLTLGCVALATVAALAALSCRPRTEETVTSVKSQEDVDTDRSKVSIERAKGGGSTFEVRYFHGDSIADGQQLFVKWGVVSAYSDDEVNCDTLGNGPTAVSHKVVEQGDKGKYGGFDIPVDEELFTKCSDAEGNFKISIACQQSGDWNGPKRLEGCVYADQGATQLVGKGWGLPTSDGAKLDGFGLQGGTLPDEDDNVTYGKLCASKLGSLPPFDCRDGQIIPVTKDGIEVPFGQHTKTMKCDAPAYLGLGTDGQCVPYARLGRLKTSNPDVDTVFICRRYKINDLEANVLKPRPADKAWHEDVAIVSHNRKSGETCWYQALSGFQPGKRSLATHRVPPPDEVDLPADVKQANLSKPPLERAMKASEFWIKPTAPGSVAGGFACIKCHDSDPFMLSPHVAQVKIDVAGVKEYLLPCDPTKPGQTPKKLCTNDGTGKYSQVSKFHQPPTWTFAQNVIPKDPGSKACIECHRIGSHNTCRSWVLDSVGIQGTVAGQSQKSNKLLAFPANHWMPVRPGALEHNYAGLASWDAEFKKSSTAIQDCCKLFAQLPNATAQAQFNAKCERSPIMTPPPGPDTGTGAVTLKIAAETAIPDNDANGVPINLASSGTVPDKPVKAITAKIDVKHPYIGHVKLELTHAGQTVTLYNGFDADIPAEANLTLDLKSSTDNSPLATFLGGSASGAWTVRATDATKHEKGSLKSFELQVTVD